MRFWSAVTCHRFGFHGGLDRSTRVFFAKAIEKESDDKSSHSKGEGRMPNDAMPLASRFEKESGD
ncbi:MAG: hypothetical protein WD894_00190 [Pirellulales bacterium]